MSNPIQVDLELFRGFLEGWKEAMMDDLTWGFPTREEFEECNECQCEPGTWEVFMLRMLDEGIVGMDGFKYCWPEEAKQIYQWMLVNGWVRSKARACQKTA